MAGMRWAERPGLFRRWRLSRLERHSNNRMLQYVPGVGARLFRHPSGHSNGKHP